jgi:hypothetical protein
MSGLHERIRLIRDLVSSGIVRIETDLPPKLSVIDAGLIRTDFFLTGDIINHLPESSLHNDNKVLLKAYKAHFRKLTAVMKSIDHIKYIIITFISGFIVILNYLTLSDNPEHYIYNLVLTSALTTILVRFRKKVLRFLLFLAIKLIASFG